MAVRLLMPKLGLNMVEGQVTEWVKKEGDTVRKGEIIYVVETDKVTNEVEAPENGTLVKILVKEGEVVPVRQIVGILAGEGEIVDVEQLLAEGKAVKPNQVQDQTPLVKAAIPDKSSAVTPAVGMVLASPLAKRLASENGIELTVIKGSGPGGRITTEDVEKAITEKKGTSSAGTEMPGRVVPLSGIRKVVAERMALSATSIPMVTLNSELEVAPLVGFREKLKKSGIGKEKIPGFNAMISFLVSRLFREFPYLNSSYTDQGIRLIDVVNIGVAVDTEDGLVVVVIKDANKKDLDEINTEFNSLVQRAISRKSLPQDFGGSTFTITNLGMAGVDSFNPIINPPEAGILGIGRFVKKDATFKAAFSLTFDHRVIDGAPAARFLQRLGELISQFG